MVTVSPVVVRRQLHVEDLRLGRVADDLSELVRFGGRRTGRARRGAGRCPDAPVEVPLDRERLPVLLHERRRVDRERTGVARSDPARRPPGRGRPVDRVVDDLDDVVVRELRGEVVEREGEAAVDDLPRTRRALRRRQRRAVRHAMKRPGEPHRSEDPSRLVDPGEGDASPRELSFASRAVKLRIAFRGYVDDVSRRRLHRQAEACMGHGRRARDPQPDQPREPSTGEPSAHARQPTCSTPDGQIPPARPHASPRRC